MHARREHIHNGGILAKISDVVTAAVGSWGFLFVHALWFGLWIGLRVEPFPYGLLTMIVSLEAIFLSTLVMMSQNRQSEKDRVRDNIEAAEVDEMASTQAVLKQINERQLEILEALHARSVQPE